MKKLVTIALMLVVMSVSAQEVIVNEKTITETERIIDKYGGQLAERFSSAMESAAPIAKEGFSMVVNLQYAKGIAYLLVIPFFFIVWFIFYKNYIIAKNDDKHDWVSGNNGGIALVSLILSVCLTIAVIPATYHGLLHVMAPEWFAIKEIAELF